MVCKVVKPVYGMAQAGRRWQRSLYPWLKEFGFEACHSDPNVFYMTRGEERLIVGCYVDDLCTLYSHSGKGSFYGDFTRALTKRWNIEDKGPISDLLNQRGH